MNPDPGGSASFCWIRIGIQGPLKSIETEPDPELDPYPIQLNVKLNYIFSRKLQYTVQNIENYDAYDANEKDKTKTGTALNKSKQRPNFP
jgi:hypothetical protein